MSNNKETERAEPHKAIWCIVVDKSKVNKSYAPAIVASLEGKQI